MSYFVEIYHDTGSYNGYYNLFELEAWERYEREIIDVAEAGEFHTIVIGKNNRDGRCCFENRIARYDYDEDTYDTHLDWVTEKIVEANNRKTSEVL